MSPHQRYPRRHRLTRGTELDVVRNEGKRVRTEHLEVRVLASLPSSPPPAAAEGAASAPPESVAASILGGTLPRVGLIVPRHRQSAVDRNRLKRRLRELVRLHLLPALPPVALVLRARAEAYGASFEQLARQVERLRRDVVRVATPKPAPQPPAPPDGSP
ncbi:MAG TPA: ribonuclease P protein component [Longimicrobium sp.]|nr:ribonuclease P protein component [Longimicrobium sp.]